MFDTFRQGLAEQISLINLAIDADGDRVIQIKTTKHHNDITKGYVLDTVNIKISDILPYKTKIVDGHQYAY